MNRLFSLLPQLCICLCLGTGPAYAGTNYAVQKVADGVYAAIAQPKGKAASSAMIVVTNYQVILAGAHFAPECIEELRAEIAKITPIPLRYVILTHHHRGFNYIDYDFPENVEIIMSWQTWQALKAGSRELKNPVTFFNEGLTLSRGKKTIVLNNTGLGHSEGDVVVYLPEEKVLFTSDLFYNEVVGFMGDGFMREWVLNLEMLEGIDARTVIPGLGKVTNSEGILRFRLIFKEFLTEVLRHVERGETTAQTKKGFHLPEYEALNGYKTFSSNNIERAYKQLKEN
jgi:glyoxylase-like metal-dependent hydrolase (beta-lactamase superfamily II)